MINSMQTLCPVTKCEEVSGDIISEASCSLHLDDSLFTPLPVAVLDLGHIERHDDR